MGMCMGQIPIVNANVAKKGIPQCQSHHGSNKKVYETNYDKFFGHLFESSSKVRILTKNPRMFLWLASWEFSAINKNKIISQIVVQVLQLQGTEYCSPNECEGANLFQIRPTWHRLLYKYYNHLLVRYNCWTVSQFV